ncbi:MAG: hypothetical protein Q9M21_03125 [Mariprofundaceae bacterium]|nr:hypothetical protein [Mariprofundaceae bacterium]
MSEHPSDEHPCKLLPWYVNGSLIDTERNSIESHITTCTTCQQEIAELEQLHAHVKHVGSKTLSPGELGLARLKQRIQSELSTTNKKTFHHWLKPARAAASIVIILQAGLMWNMDTQNNQKMQLLSGPSSADIQVIFTPNAAEAQIRALLQSIQAHIVDGPSAQGIYHIRIESEGNKKKELETAIQTLRKQGNVVHFVEKESK